MELWLLGAGAIVLIGITLWIVWPARTADPVGVSVRSEEVSENPMTETVTSGLAPQGDRFEDQYTSATADLSAGGVAAAVEAMQEPSPPESYGIPVRPTTAATTTESGRLSPRRGIGLGAGVVLALSGGIGGAWLYARWQHERNKPINRLRRGAREMAGRFGERIPDVDELPHGAAPMSGAATALLLTALVASRALHRDSDDSTQEGLDRAAEVTRESFQEAKGRGQAAVKRGRKESRQLASRIPADPVSSIDKAPKPAVMGIGVGGMALVAGGAYAVWRVLHRGQADRSTWYTGE
jgi:hypothetical protein